MPPDAIASGGALFLEVKMSPMGTRTNDVPPGQQAGRHIVFGSDQASSVTLREMP